MDGNQFDAVVCGRKLLLNTFMLLIIISSATVQML